MRAHPNSPKEDIKKEPEIFLVLFYYKVPPQAVPLRSIYK